MKLSRLASLIGIAGLMLGMMMASAGASSHREAPLISDDPKADHTDLYAFVTGDYLNIIVNVDPFEQPAGFPNGYTFSDQVLYTINIDNNGDAIADLSYGFRFHTTIRNEDTFYSNISEQGDFAITSPDDPDLNIVQTYDVVQATNGRKPIVSRRSAGVTTLLTGVYTSPNNIGPHTTPNFQDTMLQAVNALPNGGQVWAGQADDPFFVDLGALWDLAQLRSPGIDTLADFNVQSIALRLPVASVTQHGQAPTSASDPDAAIGIWAANYRPKVEVLQNTITSPHSGGPKNYQGNQPRFSSDLVQVSRLGMPLSNEVLIQLDQKDRWNRTEPRGDAQYLEYYQNPHLATLLNILYGTPGPATGRADLPAIFLTGIPGLTLVAPSLHSAVPSDMLRINLAVASGFPNGRLLTDDVTDVELSVVGLSDGTLTGLVTSGIGDNVNANDEAFLDVFPYVGVPHSGWDFDPDAGGD